MSKNNTRAGVRTLKDGTPAKNGRGTLRGIWARADNARIRTLLLEVQGERLRIAEHFARRALAYPAGRLMFAGLGRIFQRADAVFQIRSLPPVAELRALADELGRLEIALCDRIELRESTKEMFRGIVSRRWSLALLLVVLAAHGWQA